MSGAVGSISSFCNQIRDLLKHKYLDNDSGFSIWKEFIQNANSAGADQIHFLRTAGLSGSDHPILQCESLLIVNTGRFSATDANRIRQIGSSNNDKSSLGRFGLGMKSVFHLCEAFIFLSSDPCSATGIDDKFNDRNGAFSPWFKPPGSTDASPLEAWDLVDSKHKAAVVELMRPLLDTLPKLNGAEQWFCVWIPLRSEKHLALLEFKGKEQNRSRIDREGLRTKNECIENDYFKATVSLEGLSASVGKLLPLLGPLNVVGFWKEIDGTFDLVSLVHLNLDSVGERPVHPPREVPAESPSDLRFFGTIDCRLNGATEADRQIFVGQQVWLRDQKILELMQGGLEDEKCQPHAAVSIMTESSAAATRTLTIANAVFLPLSDAIHSKPELSGWDCNVFIHLHGYFFVDSGRKHILIESKDHPEQIEWNQHIRQNGTLPVLLPVLAEFLRHCNASDDQIVSLTKAIDATDAFKEGHPHICRDHQWLCCVSPVQHDGQDDKAWCLVDRGDRVYKIPQPDDVAVSPFSLLRDKCREGLHRFTRVHFVYDNRPSLCSPNGLSIWTDSLIASVIKRIDRTKVIESQHHVKYFSKLVGEWVPRKNGPAPRQLPELAASALRVFLSQVFADVELKNLRSLAEPLRKLVNHSAATHQITLEWATPSDTADKDQWSSVTDVEWNLRQQIFNLFLKESKTRQLLCIPQCCAPSEGQKLIVTTKQMAETIQPAMDLKKQLAMSLFRQLPTVVADFPEQQGLISRVICSLRTISESSPDELFSLVADSPLVPVRVLSSRDDAKPTDVQYLKTWHEFHDQNKLGLVFVRMDKADELPNVLQHAIGAAAEIWFVERENADDLFGKRHRYPACDVAGCIGLLSRFPDLEQGPDLRQKLVTSFGAREPLLKLLRDRMRNDKEKDFVIVQRAFRFLVHGEVSEVLNTEALFFSKADFKHALPTKLVQHILGKRKNISFALVSYQSWKMIGGEAAAWVNKELTESERDSLKIREISLGEKSAVWDLIRGAKACELEGMVIDDEGYSELLMTAPQNTPDDQDYNSLLCKLPIHKCKNEDGLRVAILQKAHEINSPEMRRRFLWASDYSVDSELCKDITFLVLHDDKKAQERQLEFTAKLDSVEAINLVLDHCEPQKYWETIVEAMHELRGPDENKKRKPLPEDIRKLLTERPTSSTAKGWLPVTETQAAWPVELVCLHPFNEDVKNLLEKPKPEGAGCAKDVAIATPRLFSVLQLDKDLQGHKYYKDLIEPLLQNRETSLSSLAALLKRHPANRIGPIGNEDFASLCKIEWPVAIMPSHALLKKLAQDQKLSDLVFALVASQLDGDITLDRLLDILKALAEDKQRTTEAASERTSRRTLFCSYLRIAVITYSQPIHRTEKNYSQWEGLYVPTQDASIWNLLKGLCSPDVRGVRDCDAVHQNVWSEIIKLQRPTTPRDDIKVLAPKGHLSPNVENQGDPISTCKKLCECFEGWDSRIRPSLIGLFVCLFGNNHSIRRLAQQYLGSRTWDQSRAKIGLGLEYQKRIASIPIQIEKFETLKLNNFCGDEISVRLTESVDYLLVGDVNCEPLTRLVRLRRVEPESCDPETLERILLDATLTLAIVTHPLHEDALPLIGKHYNELKLGDGQLHLFTSQEMILQQAELSFKQLGLHRHETIRDYFAALRAIHLDRGLEAESYTNGSRHEDAIVRAVATMRSVQKNLREAILKNSSLQEAILKAVRRQIRDHNRYESSSVPFELFQNADDACEEQLKHFGNTHSKFAFDLSWNNQLIAIRHNGRQINRSPSAEMAALGDFDDLVRMLTLWLSGKYTTAGDQNGQLTGKFGLGFKTVFLVCNEPQLVSGDIKCRVLGGCLPVALDSSDKQVANLREMFEGESPGNETIIGLPIEKNSDALRVIEGCLHDFQQLAQILVIFGLQIRRITLTDCNVIPRQPRQPRVVEWQWTQCTDCPGIQIGKLEGFLGSTSGSVRFGLLLLATPDTHGGGSPADGAMLLGLNRNGFARFPEYVPTFWGTTPTQKAFRRGIAINGDFAVDPGRGNLADPGNQDLAERLGSAFSERLCKLFDRSSQWESFRNELELAENVSRYQFWQSLLNVLLNSHDVNLPDCKVDPSVGIPDELLWNILWDLNHGAITKFYSQKTAFPNGLPEPFQTFVDLNEIKIQFSGDILSNNILDNILHWPSVVNRQFVASQSVAHGQEMMWILKEFKVDPTDVRIAVVVNWELQDAQNNLSPEIADRFASVLSISRGENSEWLSIVALLLDARVKVRNHPARQLRDMARVELSDEYSDAAKEFLRSCIPVVPSIETGPSGENADNSSSKDESQSKPDPVGLLNRIYGWWVKNRVEELDRYKGLEISAMDAQHLIRPVADGDIEQKRSWMRAFITAMTFTIGRQQSPQHRTFVEKYGEPWLDRIASNTTTNSNDWIAVLDEYIADRKHWSKMKYVQWMSLLPGVYFVAKHFDAYANSFQSVVRRHEPFRLDTITHPNEHPWFAPNATRLFGRGANFLIRELIRNASATSNFSIANYPARFHGFVVDGRFREVCREVGLTVDFDEKCREVHSENVYKEFEKLMIGESQRLFMPDFDIPFQVIHRKLQAYRKDTILRRFNWEEFLKSL